MCYILHTNVYLGGYAGRQEGQLYPLHSSMEGAGEAKIALHTVLFLSLLSFEKAVSGVQFGSRRIFWGQAPRFQLVVVLL